MTITWCCGTCKFWDYSPSIAMRPCTRPGSARILKSSKDLCPHHEFSEKAIEVGTKQRDRIFIHKARTDVGEAIARHIRQLERRQVLIRSGRRRGFGYK